MQGSGKHLWEEIILPPRLSPRAPDPRIREELGVPEATSLPATTWGPARAKGPPPVRFLPGLHQGPMSLLVPWQPTLWVKAQEEPQASLARARGSQESRTGLETKW